MQKPSASPMPPDDDCIRFELRIGIRRIPCAVSHDALDGCSGLPSPSAMVLRRRSFDRFRMLIQNAAALKFDTLPAGSTDPIMLTREDLRAVPPQIGMPIFGKAARFHTTLP